MPPRPPAFGPGNPDLPPLPDDMGGMPAGMSEWWEAGMPAPAMGPDTEWPGLDPAMGEDPLAPLPPGGRLDPRRPGFVENVNLQRMGVETQHALMGGEISDAEMREWSIRPWMAYPFLSTRLSPSPGLAALEQWYAAASQAGDPRAGDAFAQAWAAQFPDDARLAQQSVTALSRGLGDTLSVRSRTNEHLRSMRERGGVNWLESSFRKTKEFVWDEFRDHPLTSIGVVVSMYIMYRMFKGKNIGKYIALGIGGTVLYTFLKDRYNFQPGEMIARATEAIGGRRAGDAVRNFRDTLRRPFLGPEGEGSAVGFLQERMGINDAGERIVFQAMIRQNPRDFLAWYEQARMWQYSGPPGNVSLPGSLEQDLRSTNTPTWFRQMSKGQKAELVLRVADRMFQHIGRNSEGMDPIAYINSRYIEGQFFDQAYGEYQGDMQNAPPGSPLARLRGQDGNVRDIMGAMGHRTRVGSRAMDFLDILLMEMRDDEWHGLRNYNGAGWSAAEVWGGLRTGAETSFQFAQDWIARPAINLFTTHIPNFWTGTLSPLLSRNGITVENFQTQFMSLYNTALSAGSSTLTFVEGTPIWRALKDTGLLVWDGSTRAWTMTVEQAGRLAIYIQAQRLEQRVARPQYVNWTTAVYDPATSHLKGFNPANVTYTIRHTGATVAQHKAVWQALREVGVLNADPTFTEVGADLDVSISREEAEKLKRWIEVRRDMLTPPVVIPPADADFVNRIQMQANTLPPADRLIVTVRPGGLVEVELPAAGMPKKARTTIANITGTGRPYGATDITRTNELLRRYKLWAGLTLPSPVGWNPATRTELQDPYSVIP